MKPRSEPVGRADPVRRAGAVGRKVFWPAPNVDSGLVAWTRREPPRTTASRAQVFAVVDAAFAQRRKVLRGALSGLAGSASAAEEALVAAGVAPTARGESLVIEDFVRIAEQLRRDDGSLGPRAVSAVDTGLGADTGPDSGLATAADADPVLGAADHHPAEPHS